MASLLDIAPAVETVKIGAQSVDVSGVSAAGLASLLVRFPELQPMFSGEPIDTAKVASLGGPVVAAIIAAGCGSLGDPAAEKVAASLALDAQVGLLGAILRVTLPDGIGPFLAKLGAAGLALGLSGVVEAPVTK